MEQIINFSDEEVVKIKEEVIKLCNEYPDAKYNKNFRGIGPTCKYSIHPVTDGPETEGCVIGQGIRRACPEKFAEIVDIEKNGRKFNGGQYWSMESANKVFGPGLLADIQCAQDSGYTWGAALKLANSYLT